MHICIGWEHMSAVTHMRRSEKNLWVSLISIYRADTNNCAQVLGLRDMSICQASLEFES